MFTGSRAYKRAIRTYEILYEAFSWTLLDDFESAHTTECSEVHRVIDGVHESYYFNEPLESKELQEFCTSLITLLKIILLKEVHWQNSGSVSLKWLKCCWIWYTPLVLEIGTYIQKPYDLHYHGLLHMTGKTIADTGSTLLQPSISQYQSPKNL